MTIDAMGTQTVIAERIVESEANYILSLKKNQPTLYENVKEYFDWARTDECERKSLSTETYNECEHGRITRRRVEVSNDVSWLEERRNWKNLSSLICVTRRTEKDGKMTAEEAFYIACFPMTAKDAARYIQSHWGIENRLHWSLDVVFHEDECQIHTKNAPENLSVLRKMARAILQADTSRTIGLRRKSNIALMDNNYALSLLFHDQTGTGAK